jgi:hypothetical protein
MSGNEFVAHVIAALERAAIPYMVTGSYASSAHGRVRATEDIDIVIAPTGDQLRAFVAEFPIERYYADVEDALDALAHRPQFNLVDFATGWKVDLIIRKERGFSRVEFERRRPHVLDDVQVYVATPEDILVAKLEWAKLGESERQIEDAAGIIHRQRERLDRDYVERWVRELALEAEWQRAQARAAR